MLVAEWLDNNQCRRLQKASSAALKSVDWIFFVNLNPSTLGLGSDQLKFSRHKKDE